LLVPNPEHLLGADTDLVRELERKIMTHYTLFVGIDVSKAMLDIHVHCADENLLDNNNPDESFRCENTEAGLKSLVARAKPKRLALM
jgi:hypothetical protein